MKKLEITLGVTIILALLMNLFLIKGGAMLTILSIGTLSVFYMYMGYPILNNLSLKTVFKRKTFSDIGTKRAIGSGLTGPVFALQLIGILFYVQSWVSGEYIQKIGVILAFVHISVTLIKYRQNQNIFYKNLLIRSLSIGGLLFILFISPKDSWLNFKYRNHPDYLKAINEAQKDIDNVELWNKVDEERKKIK
ncbi:MAG: hypothetical protein ACPGSD_05820 [Flavobacteriales bacterium]